jgi:flagellar motor protein MotB
VSKKSRRRSSSADLSGAAHAHHGGAWKVAYADFVTAMMAFFLLLWLLNAVSKEQLEGISDYFAPISTRTSTSGGGGLLAGETVTKKGVFRGRVGARPVRNQGTSIARRDVGGRARRIAARARKSSSTMPNGSYAGRSRKVRSCRVWPRAC